jgi:hypothetical protein
LNQEEKMEVSLEPEKKQCVDLKAVFFDEAGAALVCSVLRGILFIID